MTTPPLAHLVSMPNSQEQAAHINGMYVSAMIHRVTTSSHKTSPQQLARIGVEGCNMPCATFMMNQTALVWSQGGQIALKALTRADHAHSPATSSHMCTSEACRYLADIQHDIWQMSIMPRRARGLCRDECNLL